MKHVPTVVRLSCCLLAGLSSPVFAEQDLAVLGGATLYSLKEHDRDGRWLVHESGGVPQAALAWRLQRGLYRVGFSGDLVAGDIDYDGQTQTGIPHQTVAQHIRGQGTLAMTRHFGRAGDLSGLLRLEADWRDLQPSGNVSGAREFYRHVWLGAGYANEVWQSPGHSVTLRMAWMKPVNSQQEVYPQNGTDDFTLVLDQGFAWEAGVDYARRYAPGREWLLQAQCRHAHFEASPSILATINGAANGSAYYQPEIEFRSCGVSVGIRRSWP